MHKKYSWPIVIIFFAFLLVGTAAYAINPGLPLILSPGVLPEAYVGGAYSQTLSVSNGQSPYTWAANDLPAHCTLADGIDDSQKIISGTFTAEDIGLHDISVGVTDGNGNQVNKVYKLVVSAADSVPVIVTSKLAPGKQGQEYDAEIIASGGALPRTWSLESGSLPQGITLYEDGVLYGTPSESGLFTFLAKVTDAAGKSAEKSFNLSIAPTPVPPLAITGVGPLTAQVGIDFMCNFTATGGAAPYTWSGVEGGNFPEGFVLEENGFFEGKPSLQGEYVFNIIVNDQLGKTATGAVNLSILPEPLHLIYDGLASWTVEKNTDFSWAVPVSGGTEPYHFSIQSGALPSGLSFKADTGLIYGKPGETGTYTSEVLVKDSAENPESLSIPVTIKVIDPVKAQFEADKLTGSAPLTVTFTDKSTGPVTVWEWDFDDDGIIDSREKNPVFKYSAEGLYSVSLAVFGPDMQSNDTTLTDYINVTKGQSNVSGNGGGGGGGGPTGSALTINTGSLPEGTAGKTYSATLTAGGGSLPYTWSATGLPAGLEINASSGVISGIPAKEGKYTVSVSVKDNSGGKVSKNFDLTVKAAEIAPEKPSEPAFKDIAGHWAENSINSLVATGAISGYPDGSFRPDEYITRAEFATVLVKALKLGPRQGRVFADSSEHWAKDYISAAAVLGIVSGFDEGSFGPDELITREQMAVMVVKCAKLSIVREELSFADSEDISGWAKDSVVTAVKSGIMSGYPDNTFRPGGNATRAEAVTVIAKLLK